MPYIFYYNLLIYIHYCLFCYIKSSNIYLSPIVIFCVLSFSIPS